MSFYLWISKSKKPSENEEGNREKWEKNQNQLLSDPPASSRAIVDEGKFLVWDYVNLIPALVQSTIIYPPFGYANFHVRQDIINLFRSHQGIRFSGRPTKNLHEHIWAFLMLCEVISHEDMLAHAFRLHLFPHILKKGTREWLYLLCPRIIILWNDKIHKFILKFFSSSRVHIKIKWTTYFQAKGPQNLEAWDRFKNYFRKCPNLDISKKAKVHIFYLSLQPENYNMVDALARISIMTLPIDNALDLFERITENQLMWLSKRETSMKTTGI